MLEEASSPDSPQLGALMSHFSDGHDEAGDQLCASLEPGLRRVADGFLGPDDPDLDDLIQDALVALLGYLRRGGPLPDNPRAFAATIIRNRCRNLYRWRKSRPAGSVDNLENWYASPTRSPLDLLLEGEIRTGLQTALDRLEAACSRLLRGLYLERRTMEQMRDKLGLTSVQAVYYRRNRCLEKIKKIFIKSGFGGPDQGNQGVGK